MSSKKASAPPAGAAPKSAPVGRQYSVVQLGDYLVNSQVWIKAPDSERLYALATVKSISGTDLTVEVDGQSKTVPQKDCLNANVGVKPETCNDLSKLPHANEAAALDILRERYERDLIYVSDTSVRGSGGWH